MKSQTAILLNVTICIYELIPCLEISTSWRSGLKLGWILFLWVLSRFQIKTLAIITKEQR